MHLQFFHESRVRVRGKICAALLAHGRARVEEVDAEVGVVALDGLRDVLDDRDVEGDRNAEDRDDDRLVLFV